jgi:hypothetical protein
VTLSELNYSQLRETFYVNTSAPKASKILRKKGGDLKYMRVLLRHHEQKRISDKETWQRDYFDNLLSYYSMLELALLAGAVESLPEGDKAVAVTELSHPALGVYYREHYRLVLPQFLLERLKGQHRSVVSSGKAINAFLQYVPLAHHAETDEDMECFLWFLDGGVRGGYDYSDTLEVLGSRKRLLKSMLKRPSDKTPLDASVEGFGKFLNFCVQLDVTLQASSNWPLFQSEVYENHSYWFQQMGRKLGKQVFRALNNYVEVKEEDSPADRYFMEAENSLKRLLSGKYRGNQSGLED